jgi:hypothetical protein
VEGEMKFKDVSIEEIRGELRRTIERATEKYNLTPGWFEETLKECTPIQVWSDGGPWSAITEGSLSLHDELCGFIESGDMGKLMRAESEEE